LGALRLKTTLWLSLAAGIAVMLALALLADFGETLRAVGGMQVAWLPLLILFSLANYATRWLKWEYFLRLLSLRLPARDSIGVFIGGFTFSITPGKLGEVFKAFLLKEIKGVPVARSAPVVFAERFTDLGGLLILASVGVGSSGRGGVAWLAGIIFLGLLFGLLSVRRFETFFVRFLGRLKPLQRFAEPAGRALDSARILLKPRNLPGLMLLSAASWFWECWALVYAVKAFGADLALAQAIFIYAIATLAGALVFLPGGLGVTEGSLAMLLAIAGLAPGQAAAATLVIRLTTLWFAVGIGLLALYDLDRRWHLGSKLWGGFRSDERETLPEPGRSGS
jgi:uncharacterized protein (TIRG00374 family)